MNCPFLDRNFQKLAVSDFVDVQHCCGPYGQVRQVRGHIESFDQYGGIYIILAPGTPRFTEYSRLGSVSYTAGDKYYICNAFEYDSERKALVGFHEHHDFEHGHVNYCVKTPALVSGGTNANN